MSLISLQENRDIVQNEISNKTSFALTSLSAAQNKNINSFVAQASDTAYMNNAQGTVTTTPLSSAFRNIANYYFSSTASAVVPVAHNLASTTSLIRAMTIGRTTSDDGIVSGTVTATFTFGTSANNTYIDIPESSITGSVGRKGSLVSQSNTSNIVGTVFYDTASLLFHGGTGWPHFLCDSASGFTFGAASAGFVVCTSLSFQALNILKQTMYFCRAFPNECNYTTNPTAISNPTLGTISGSLTSSPTTYVTTVGLYNDSGEILAVGKVSPPVRKLFTKEISIVTTLQY